MKLSLIIYLLTSVFAMSAFAADHELSRERDFIVIYNEHTGSTYFLRADIILSVSVELRGETFTQLTIATSEFASVTPTGEEANASFNKTYSLSFSSKDEAVKFAQKLIRE